MNLVAKILPYAQIILSVILVAAVLLQQSAGFERFLFYLSLVCGILFALLALLSIIIKANS